MMVDLEEAVEITREATYLVPESHQHRIAWLYDLGYRLRDNFSENRGYC